MTPERAKEIIRLGGFWANYSAHCTAEEDAEVRALWATMAGSTCWYDALLRIARGEVEEWAHEEAELGRKLRQAAREGKL